MHLQICEYHRSVRLSCRRVLLATGTTTIGRASFAGCVIGQEVGLAAKALSKIQATLVVTDDGQIQVSLDLQPKDLAALPPAIF